MRKQEPLQARISELSPLVSGIVDCFHEGTNNARRREWEFAALNLRTLFRNANQIAKQRTAVLRELRRAENEWRSHD